MAFVHGKGAVVLHGLTDASGYFNSLDVELSVDPAETTTFGKNAKTFIPGLKDGKVSLGGLFDVAIDAVLSAAIGASTGDAVTVAPQALALGGRVWVCSSRSTSYKSSVPVGGVVAASMSIQADNGVDPGVVLADLSARTATANLTAVDSGVTSTLNGWSANLHCTVASGTSPTLTVKLQDSADNSTFADLTGGAFTQLTAAGSQHLEGTGTVRRYVRAVYTIGGTTPSFTAAVGFARR